jgi:formate dehydrogenase major subunit
MGSSMAENHPVGFQWVMEARERGAKVIHVDPRFTRTSAMADIWVPLRAGCDIIFLGAMVNYVLTNNKEFREYVVNYTNAATLLIWMDCSPGGTPRRNNMIPRVGCTGALR